MALASGVPIMCHPVGGGAELHSPRGRRSVWKEKLANIIMQEDERMRRRSEALMSFIDAEDVLQIEKAKCEEKVTPTSIKQKINAILDASTQYRLDFAPWSRRLALFVHLFIFIAIVTSVTLLLVESLPQYYGSNHPTFWISELVCVVFFTVELLMRFSTTDNRARFCYDLLNIIDLLSIMPTYLGLFVSGNSAVQSLIFLRSTRLIKVLRVLQVGKVSENLQYVQKSLTRSLDALYLLFFLILISTILFSSAMFLAETSQEYYDEGTHKWYTKSVLRGDSETVESKFQSIPHTFWWALVTLCTVGYGDFVPNSYAGKGVAAATMLAGTLVIAFPVILIGANFNEIVLERQRANSKKHTLETVADLRIQTCRAFSQFARDLADSHPMLGEGSSRHAASVVTSFNAGNKRIAITMDGDEKAQFMTYRYSPLLDVRDLCCTGVGGGFVISFSLVLDSLEMQANAHMSITSLGGSYADVLSGSVFVRESRKISLSIPLLGPLHLLTDTFHNPGAFVTVMLQADTFDDARTLKALLPDLEVAVHWKGAAEDDDPPDIEATVPLGPMLLDESLKLAERGGMDSPLTQRSTGSFAPRSTTSRVTNSAESPTINPLAPRFCQSSL